MRSTAHWPVVFLVLVAPCYVWGAGTVHTFNGTADQQSAGASNTALLNKVLGDLGPGDTLLVPNRTFWLAGGVRGSGLVDTTIRLDGTLKFLPGRKGWPTQNCADGGNPLQPKKNGTCVQEAILLQNISGLTLTTSDEDGVGTLFGSGDSWWGYLQYLIHGEDRPRLISIINATDLLVERWHFLQSPYWTFTALDVLNLEISQCAISNRVNNLDSHGITDLDAFNTDGFDVAGKNIYIHDSQVWNQDDCFTIQPLDSIVGKNAHCTENVLIENVEASGLGLTVGAVHPSLGHNCVRNVTFRNARMHHTFKGIYLKTGSSFDPAASGEITNILYENITMDVPEQVPIWIGPAQEADSKGACSLLWPEVPFEKCPPPPTTMAVTNITLRNIRVTAAKQSPGVVLGNSQTPMKGLVFDNVVFDPADPSKKPWGADFYHCEGVQGVATGGTSPTPPCFEKQ